MYRYAEMFFGPPCLEVRLCAVTKFWVKFRRPVTVPFGLHASPPTHMAGAKGTCSGRGNKEASEEGEEGTFDFNKWQSSSILSTQS